MKIENQVCTLEQGVKLFNYGITQSLFNHVHTKDGKEHWIDHNSVFDENNIYIPAFTVAELGVMLPNKISGDIKLSQWRGSKQYFRLQYRYYKGTISNGDSELIHSSTESEARAAMLIYLLENKYVTSEEVNAKLLNS